MSSITRVAAAIAAAAMMTTGAGAQAPSADVIITNAKAWTVDASKPTAEAVAITGDRIVAVGSAAEIAARRGPRTRVIDAHNRTLLPGFNDAHIHLTDAGFRLDDVQLKDATSHAELARRIGERAKVTPKGEWILGGEWDDQAWSDKTLPTVALIDAVAPDTPVFVKRYDGHTAIANSLALKLAGITAATPDVPGGVIARDANGNPTGIFKDGALPLVERVIPAIGADQRLRAIRRALAFMARNGVTSTGDVLTTRESIAALQQLDRAGELTARIYVAPRDTEWLAWKTAGTAPAYASPYLHVDGVKVLMDGSLGSTTAYFFEPYTDAPNTSGMLREDIEPLSKTRDRLATIDAFGQQLVVHAIGDRAISSALDMFEAIVATNPARDRRLRVEHAQHMAMKDFDRFARLHVVASVQPYHAIDDGRWAERRIGPERAKTTYAFKTFKDNGVRLAFGTDWFHASLNPLETLYAAVTRATLDGKRPGGWVPEQKLSLADAIEAYTMGSAYAEFRETDKGSITAGKLADLVLLGADIFAVEPATLRDVTVDLTVVGGKVVYDRTATR